MESALSARLARTILTRCGSSRRSQLFIHTAFLCFSGKTKGLNLYQRLAGTSFTLGTVAVDAFFLISGFLIVMSWERSSSPLSYLWKRIARIVPGYVCATLIGLFVVTPIFVKPGQTWLSLPVVGHCAKAMLHLLAFEVGGVFPLNPFPGVVNGSIWSVSYEFKCYLGVLFLGLIGAARRRWIALILFPCSLVLCALHLFAKPFDFITLHWSAIRLDSYFAAGAVFYLYRDRISIKPGWAVLSIAAIVGSLLLPSPCIWFYRYAEPICCFGPFFNPT